MLICQFCEEEYCMNEDFDRNKEGFWCDVCDGYTYYDDNALKHQFTLILEDKEANQPLFSTPSIKFRKQLSPFRFPGGKSKVVDYLYSFLQNGKTTTLYSPFSGGGSFELAMLDAGVVNKLHMNDLDFGVYSVWWVIMNAPYTLVDKIRTAKPTHKDYFEAQAIIKSDYLGVNMVEASWATLLVNRLAFSGIAKANPLGGKEGTKNALLARWNREELIKRIEHIHSFSDRITITQENAVEMIQEAYWDHNSSIFIDPPYVAKGKELYNCFYTESDHLLLCGLLDSLHQGMPGADIIVTYDHTPWLQKIYKYPNELIIGRKYSI
ncbi:DNA adenine methylase [Sporosarcina sp. FSL K6-1508]|uniref:DNA adenine methylase n=1 Tax=Sporosarcina sp. FSL K6-1508 TaxID=2921553 RepID=UPI0030FB3155